MEKCEHNFIDTKKMVETRAKPQYMWSNSWYDTWNLKEEHIYIFCTKCWENKRLV